MLVVVDVDPPHGGDLTLDDLTAPRGKLPQTPATLTGTGRHHFFQHAGQSIRHDAGKKPGAGLDLRGDGGSVVLHQSRHASSRAYEWEASSHPNNVPLAPVPTWLLDRLRD